MENSPFPSIPPEEESTEKVHEFWLLTALLVILLHGTFVYDHICCWEKPKEQRIIVLLLLIPPIQAIISWYQFRTPNITDTLFIILDSIKQCYTALIFPLFLSLLYTYLKLNDETLSSIYLRVIIGGRQISNFFPVTLIQPECVSINLSNLKFFEYSASQYVVIRLLSSVLMIIFQLLRMYPVWLSCVFFVILNLSFLLAFYTVYVFYQAFRYDFRLHVYYKYNFFRLILFACFFQGAVIRVAKETGIIQANLQNILVIAEMVLFSIPTSIAFPALDYAPIPILPVFRPVCCQSSTYQVSE